MSDRDESLPSASAHPIGDGATPENRLDSWKEIARYLNRDVTTVQRWEKLEGMPVHRHLHGRIGSIHAYRAELDAWARGRTAQSVPEEVKTTSARSPGRPFSLLKMRLVLTACVAGLAILLVARAVDRTGYFWRSPLDGARFQTLTDFDGIEESAAISRDGQFVAFLSDKEGQPDVWVTQVASGQFHNLTKGSVQDISNPSLRSLGFSPDGALVTFWKKTPGGPKGDIGTWAVPTLGGQPRPYLEGVAEFDWSPDASRLAFHTPGPGDPMFVSGGGLAATAKSIFAAPKGLHSHFPVWSPDMKYLYFVQGSLPDKLDIWRITPTGGEHEKITSHAGPVSYPVFLNERTLLYLAGDTDGSGPWLYSMDLEHRTAHRLTSELDRYTSLAASADGRRLVVTRTSPKITLWKFTLDKPPVNLSSASRISLNTGAGFSPRLGPGYLLYVSSGNGGQSIWKFAEGNATELWRGPGAHILGAPAISPDGADIAFSVQLGQKSLLHTMRADGTNVRIINDSLRLNGSPAWMPAEASITVSAGSRDAPRLYRIPLDGKAPSVLVNEYSLDPAWAPDGRFAVYSGPDVGTTFPMKAITASAKPLSAPSLTLTRGARRLKFLPGGKELVFLRGDLQHKNLYAINLESGIERQLTNLSADFNIRDFDIAPDGREIVLERVQQNSDLVLLEIPKR